MNFAITRDLSAIRSDHPSALPVPLQRERALKMVLAIVFTRHEAAALLGVAFAGSRQHLPGSVYGVLAAAAPRSAVIWRRCAAHIDARLADTSLAAITPSVGACPELAELCRHLEVMSWRDVAQTLWTVVRDCGHDASGARALATAPSQARLRSVGLDER
ncbi:MAG: hypothetical protein Tsb0020_09180 [Haliangiales bacterium]